MVHRTGYREVHVAWPGTVGGGGVPGYGGGNGYWVMGTGYTGGNGPVMVNNG